MAVLWRNWLFGSRALYVATGRKDGTGFGAAIKRGAGIWPLGGCPMDGGAVTALPDGSFASIWRREKSVYLTTKPGEEIPLGKGRQPVLAAGREGLFAVWQSEEG